MSHFFTNHLILLRYSIPVVSTIAEFSICCWIHVIIGPNGLQAMLVIEGRAPAFSGTALRHNHVGVIETNEAFAIAIVQR